MPMYHTGQRELQDQFDTRRLADRLEEKLVRDVLNAKQKAFIESADMFFLATADEQGRPSCSYRGGDPGFVRVVDDRTLALPNWDGDGMYISWGNVLANPNVGMLFIDFMKGWRLRIHGTASIAKDDPLLQDYREAQFIVRITICEAFGNCSRYVHKYQLVERSAYVPRAGCVTPIPDWKNLPENKEVLPANDPARKR
jgi:predicted pyridoxine 5'-phosphate oxidase superfamily flavin-nucleotide-binding protein